jgi:hypothetical protein
MTRRAKCRFSRSDSRAGRRCLKQAEECNGVGCLASAKGRICVADTIIHFLWHGFVHNGPPKNADFEKNPKAYSYSACHGFITHFQSDWDYARPLRGERVCSQGRSFTYWPL